MHSPVTKSLPRRRHEPNRLWPVVLLCLPIFALPSAAWARQKGGRVIYTETNGEQIYKDRCALCHMVDGGGKTDGSHGFPPLTGMSEWMAMREGQLYVAHALIFGPYGGIMVGDIFYDGIMTRFGHRLNNEQMIAVIRYVAEKLNTPLPGYKPIDSAIIDEARKRTDHIDAVHAERDRLPPR